MSVREVHLLIALPDFPVGMAQLRTLVPRGTVERIEPYPRGTILPPSLLAPCSILVADFPPSNYSEMRELEWIQLGSAGYQQLRGMPLRSRRIRVTNASGVNDVPIAEWCLLMMLLFERDLPAMLQLRAKRAWVREPRFQSELRGRRVGIIGYGSIGREVARLSRMAGLEVWALNRSPIGRRGYRFAVAGTGDPDGELPHRTFRMEELDQFLPHLDYLVLSAALNSGSRGLLSEQELRLLSPHTVLLNPARADLVDETALVRSLRDGWIRGAALDSHYREPLPEDDPFWDLERVVLTPHISGSTGSPQYQQRLWELTACNLRRFLHDQPLLNEVSWEDLDAG